MPRLSKIGAACLSAFGFGTGGAAAVTTNYLVVAGGGGGGWGNGGGGGGGGAGGLLSGSFSLSLTQTYTVIVGAGGIGATSTVLASSGNSSSINAISTTGGGYGGGTAALQTGGNGGSGGGAGNSTPGASGGTGVSGQGYAGGSSSGSAAGYNGGGGGGAGAVGGNGTATVAGVGGVGYSSSITGSATYYAGGGGAGSGYTNSNGGGAGGNGGGGAGSTNNTSNGTAGTANLGGGGGGVNTQLGGNGGSGVVIVAYAGAQKFGGGIVSSDGTNTIHTFKTSGQLVPMTPITASYLIVAGGASGGGLNSGGGGGAGGLLTGSTLSIDTSSTYLVTVGAGGTGTSSGAQGNNGTSSSFSLIGTTAVGGGGGGTNSATGSPSTGATGGSGGGGSYNGGAGGSATTSQGYAGGTGSTSAGVGAGGGGAGAVGDSPTSHTSSRAGGIGISSSITGTATYYAGGGGGGSNGGSSARGYGDGGLGGGGAGGIGYDGPAATSGTSNTGGGGGGAGGPSYTLSGNGGSGVVIISYAGTTQLMAGGIVTIVGGNVIHTFTSSGYLTPLTFIGRSLRFRSSASAYLNRTPPVASNRQTWTYSAWVKRGKLGAGQALFSVAGSGYSTGYFTLSFNSSDYISVDVTTNSSSTDRCVRYTNAVYRDPAAWYHVTFTYDVTQATDSNRLKLYVNGVQQTLGQAIVGTYPTQNTNGPVNSSVLSGIGYRPTDNDSYFDGYQANVQFIDGQALTPNSFGTFNSYGVWQPINYGGSYGTNGFHLPFSDTTSTTTLCYDQGPQGNHWTPNNISLTAGTTYDSMTDVPTLTSATAANYAVLNPLAIGLYSANINGNLTISGVSSTNGTGSLSTIGFSSGKFYYEAVANSTTACQIGVVTYYANNPAYLTDENNVYGTTGSNKGIGIRGSGSTYGNTAEKQTIASFTFSAGDVIGIATDADNGAVYFSVNGSWLNSGVPTSGASKTGSFSNWTPSADRICYPAACAYSSGNSTSVNFGQRPFAYTPPTGYVALNTYNL